MLTAAHIGAIAGHHIVTGTARYWRLYFENPAPGYVYPLQVRKVKMYSVVGGDDICGGGVASASDESVGYEASKAFDDDAGTAWGAPSNIYDKWLAYDFGTAVDVVQFQITNSNGNYHEQVKLQYSEDGSSWTDVGVTMAARYPGLSGGSQKYLPGGINSYWRLYATALTGWYNLQIKEIEFRLTSGGADVTSPNSATRNYTFADDGAAAFDDNAGTVWSGGFNVSGPWWIWIGIGEDMDCKEMSYTIGSGIDQAPSTFKIQYSGDGFNWTDAKSVSGETGWSSGETRNYTW